MIGSSLVKKIILKPGREKSLLQRHPWVFSGAVEKVIGNPEIGETVAVCDSAGHFLGWGAYSPSSQIRVRVWSLDEEEKISAEFFYNRIQTALWIREKSVLLRDTNAYRLVHAESDGLPGLIVDRYSDWLVVQFLSAGANYWKKEIVSVLSELGVSGIYERSDVEVRRLEGLSETRGGLWGKEPPSIIRVKENGFQFAIDIQTGQKTGFYLDQRVNRERLQEYCQGKDVLNCFCYTGGFTVYALAGGANSVLSIDSSDGALALADENVKLNQLPEERNRWLEADVFLALRKFRDEGRSFDLIVLDPPKFASTAAQAQRAARGYKDINLLAIKLLKPGGILFTFSCSGGITPELFQKIVAGAAIDARADVQILERLYQSPDHPVLLTFPEGEYLKGLVCIKRPTDH